MVFQCCKFETSQLFVFYKIKIMKVLIFKAIEICNSNCIYCDVIKKGSKSIMSYEILELVFHRLNEYLIEFPEEQIQFVWHGGEPCMLGVEYFEKAIFYQDKHCSTTKQRIKHDVQSNITLINQELIDVFKRMGMNSIGTSFEPIHKLRGPGKDRDSIKYNRDFFKGTNLLKENNMNWGAIYVITKKSLGKALDLFYFLENMNLNAGICYNVVKLFEEDTYDLKVTVDEWADWMGAIFEEWYKHRDRYPGVMPFTSIMKSMEENVKYLGCEDSGSCAYGWMYIGPTGKVSHCGRAGDYGMLDYGHIKDKTIKEILEDEQREVLAQRNKVLSEGECKDCRFWAICHGGCPLDANMSNKDFHTRYPFCGSKPKLYEKYIEPITGIKVDFSPCTVKTHKNDVVDFVK